MKYMNHKPVVYYICQYGYWDVVKIGTTVNLSRRLAQYQSKSSDISWHILAVEEGEDTPFALEAARHRDFMKSRISGEWFWMTPDLKEHILGLPDLVEVYLP